MDILTLIIGTILITLSMKSMLGWFSIYEWKAPLLELNSELKGYKNLQPGIRFRGVSIPIFFLILFGIGGIIIVRSSILQSYRKFVLIIIGILLLWLLKGTYELIKATYSKKTRLLNYLFSPYLFAWRRDHLNEYSDKEIASAICKVCNINDKTLIQENITLKKFLIALHQKTRPSIEHDAYPEILEENLKQAEQLIPK